jgi:hypothetical protein
MSVLVIGNHYWGHAEDLATAKKNFRQQGGQLSLGYSIFEFGSLEFRGVTQMGYIQWKGDGEPVVTEVPPKGKKR